MEFRAIIGLDILDLSLHQIHKVGEKLFGIEGTLGGIHPGIG